ncbi:MAG TPA: DUF2752 domain-containing protein [Bryobacteraceae bacterium]|nr:DUF2752 domain-containing protein [Bryobacteraceae bacterium]
MTSRAGFAATVLGMVLLAELAITNLAFTADSEFVYLFGHRINVVCAARQRLGLPCPTCGFTRGFVMTAHGRVTEAWKLSPAGPLAAGGIFGMGLALLIFAALERRSHPAQLAKVKRWLQNGALAYGGIATLIWICSWISVVTNLSRTKG